MAEQRRFEVGQKWRDVYSPYEVVVIREVLTNGVYYDWPDLAGCFRGTSDFLENFQPADTSPTADPVVEQCVDDLRTLKKCHGCGKDANTLQAWNDQAGNRFCNKSCCEGWSTKTAGRLLIGVDPAFGATESVKSWASRVNDESVAASMRQRDLDSGATARLVAALAAEHTRQADSSGLLHPRSWWSARNPGRRSR